MEEQEVIIDNEAEFLDSGAPSERIPEVLRDRATRPPNWRYLAACDYVRDSRNGINPVVPRDPVVIYAARALGRQKGMPGAVSEITDRCWPDLADAIYYGVQGRESATTCEMDACLIKGWTWKQAREAGCPVSEAVYLLYAALFMDLSGMAGAHSLVHDYLFEPSRYRDNPGLLRTHILAYYGSGASGLNVSVLGYMSSEDTALVQRMIRSERAKQMFDYVAQNLPIARELHASNMESALKVTADREFQEHMKDRDDAGSESLDELANGLEGAIRAYSQTEIEAYDKEGLDFDNQYTRKLIGQNDGKENIQ